MRDARAAISSPLAVREKDLVVLTAFHDVDAGSSVVTTLSP